MIFIFVRPQHARMLVERKGDIDLKGQARAFEDDLLGEFGHAIIVCQEKSCKKF